MTNTIRTARAALIFALCAMASPAAAGTTPNYGWATPTVGADENSWGSTLNSTTGEIDADLKAVENIATGVNATANPAMWQSRASGIIPAGSGDQLTLGELQSLQVAASRSSFNGRQRDILRSLCVQWKLCNNIRIYISRELPKV